MSWQDSEAFEELLYLLRFLGYDVTLNNRKADLLGLNQRNTDQMQNFTAGNLTINGEPVYLVLDKTNSQKKRFLELFVNRGWQPQLKKLSPHGPRSGPSAQVDSVNNPISTIWEIRDPDNLNEWMMKDNSVEAELLGEMGSGGNEWIYIWSGYLAVYPEGYSNMILMEWFDAYADDADQRDGVSGKIYYGEKAYQKLKELRTRPREGLDWLSFYASINRRVIP